MGIASDAAMLVRLIYCYRKLSISSFCRLALHRFDLRVLVELTYLVEIAMHSINIQSE